MRPLRVLLVDDDLDLADGIADVLELEGHRVTLAPDGEQALTMLPSDRFDVAFIDVKLPRINGFQILVGLREHHPDITAVMMSGFRIDQLCAFVSGRKTVQFFRYPVTVEALLAELEPRDGEPGLVLMADDGDAIAETVADSLNNAGRKASVAHSKQLAADSVEAREILILDMPYAVRDSLEFYALLQKSGPVPPTIIVAPDSRMQRTDDDAWDALAATGCLFKPFSIETLIKIARRLSGDRPELASTPGTTFDMTHEVLT